MATIKKKSDIYIDALHIKVSPEQKDMIRELSICFDKSIAGIIRQFIELEYGRYKAGRKGDLS